MKGKYARLALACLLVVPVGAAVPAQAQQSTGSITGRLTNGDVPLAGTWVTVMGPIWATVQTDSDGVYRASDLEPGADYRVKFDHGTLTQYAQGKLGYSSADVFTVRAGEETVVNDSLLPRGAIEGRFTEADGSPIPGTAVTLSYMTGETGGYTVTDADGRWRFDTVFAGPYTVGFHHQERGIAQSAFGQVGWEQPGDTVTVAANATTTVDDVAVPRGSILVRARDSLTGNRIDEFYAEAGASGGFTETGEILLDLVQAGNRHLRVYVDGYHDGDLHVAVNAGQQTEVTVDLTPVSAIDVTVVDASTGAPVQGVCVQAVSFTDAAIDSECEYLTDELGRYSSRYLRAGKYQLFAIPREAPGYGAQWVGADGGTGRQLKAKTIGLAAGQTKEQVIKLDRAGTITGRVTTSDGQPSPRTSVGLMFGGEPWCCGAPATTWTDENGVYTIAFAGPYDWPLSFTTDQRQFSGQVGNRHLAPAVKVTAGGTTNYDYRFKAPVDVTVTGVPNDRAEMLFAVNALSGDPVGWVAGDFSGPLTFPVVGPQFVKFWIYDRQGGTRWHGGADFAHAKPVWIPSSGTKTVALNF